MSRKSTPPETRFWAKVDKKDPEECWLWTAGLTSTGSGQFGHPNGRPVIASRFAWELTYGAPAEGKQVRHLDSCPNRKLCCNPAHLYETTTTEARFWRKVVKTAGCWIFTGSRGRGGHGSFTPHTGGGMPAHKYSYELVHGPVEDGLVLRHRCDVSSCVNPEHLLPGTYQENFDDRSRCPEVFA